MKVTELIQHFAGQETLPVSVNDVLRCLQENGHDDDIEFIGVDIDPDVLQGWIRVFHSRARPYADPVRMVNIYYSARQGLDRQRMVCAKELMHLMDPADAYTATPDATDRLAEKMGLPPEMQDPFADGHDVNIDRLAEFRAAALLLPLAARAILLEPYRRKELSVGEIAQIADMPTRYATFVMSEQWERVHPLLI